MALHKEGDVASGTLAAAPTTADVVILGGGIAGLATAAFLRQRTTLDVIVVDRGDVLASKRDEKDEVDEAEQHGLDGPVAADTSDSDYGIALAPNGTAILSLLGMNDPVTALQGSELNKMLVRSETNPNEPRPSEFPARLLFGAPSIFCRRSALLTWLLDRCIEDREDGREKTRIYSNRKITGLDVDSSTATDDQGSTYQTGFFICADGIAKIGRTVISAAAICKDENLAAPTWKEWQPKDEICVQCAYMAIVPKSALAQRPSLKFMLEGSAEDGPPCTLSNWIYDPPAAFPSRHGANDAGAAHQEAAVDGGEKQNKGMPSPRQRRIIIYPVDAEGNHQLFAYFPVDTQSLARFGRDASIEVAADSHGARKGMLRGIDANEALSEFSMFHEELRTLLCLKPTIDLCLIRDSDPIKQWSACGRYVLIGDAAHATVPHTGQGSAQALEDAEALSYFLAEPHPFAADRCLRSLPSALKAFESLRVPRARLVQDTARISIGIRPGIEQLDMEAYSQEVMTWRGVAASGAAKMKD